MEVHRHLGPGLLESVYRECLSYELSDSGLYVQAEVSLPLIYKKKSFDRGFRIDLLVENQIVVELKTVESLNDVHLAQILTYLRIGHYKVGLLINFNVTSIKQGIRRVVL
jgi:GxxExxY protein